MTPEEYTATRLSLHVVADRLMAGPQSLTSNTVRLQVCDGGFRTLREPDIRCISGALDYAGNSARIDGQSLNALGAELGLSPSRPTFYPSVSAMSFDEPLTVVEDAMSLIATWYAWGVEAIDALGSGESYVLWPEHFDAAIAWEEVGYGVSPGDDFHPWPYAYVQPWEKRQGDFWNAPFGAYIDYRDADSARSIAEFFLQGRARALADPLRESTD